MRLLKQSSTAQPLTFLLILTSDHITGATGKTPTVKLSKSGGTGVTPSGTISEVDATNHPGLYKIAGNATDTGTLGPLWLHATATGCDPVDIEFEVVAFDPQSATNLGLSNLDATISSRGTSTYAGGDTAGTTTLLGRVTGTVPLASDFTSARATKLDNLDATVTSRMATYTQPSGFLAATFPTTVASTTNITGGTITTVSGNVSGSVGGISGVTFPTGFSTLTVSAIQSGLMTSAAYTTPPTASAISTQVNADLTAAHGSGSYTAAAVTAASIGGVTVSAGTVTTAINVANASGSLAQHVAAAIDSRIDGKTLTNQPIFSNLGTYTLNPARWCLDIDLTGVEANANGTLITPRHVYGVEHYGVGGSVRFVKQDGTVVVRTVISTVNIGPPNASDGNATDIQIGRLDSDVPAGITPVKVMPAGSLTTKLPNYGFGVPVLVLNGARDACVAEFKSFSPPTWINYNKSIDSQRALFFKDAVVGDSGSPVFFIINGAPVLLTSWSDAAAGSGQGVDLSAYIDDINAAITSLGGGGALSTVDLSGFPTNPVVPDNATIATIAAQTTHNAIRDAANEAITNNGLDETATAVATYLTAPVATAEALADLAAAVGEGGGGGAGNGDVPVDHDYGGTDTLRFTLADGTTPIDDALVTALVDGTINGQTRTGSDGRWISPLMLDAGTYTIVFSKPGLVTKAVDVAVS